MYADRKDTEDIRVVGISDLKKLKKEKRDGCRITNIKAYVFYCINQLQRQLV